MDADRNFISAYQRALAVPLLLRDLSLLILLTDVINLGNKELTNMPLNQAIDQGTFQEFHAFVEDILGGLGDRSLEEAIIEYRAFQTDRERVLARLQLARLESCRGQSRELDDDAFWQRMNARLDQAGVPK